MSDGTASPRVFNPKQFDPEQWMTAIQASSARYVVLVANTTTASASGPRTRPDYSIKQSR